MQLNDKQRRHLRGLAHDLKPVVMVGDSGLTDGVVRETERALHDHELIKIKVRAADRDTRDALIADLATRTTSELVNRIGHVAVLYRKRPDKTGIVLPA
jgi:RNA-binding protein